MHYILLVGVSVCITQSWRVCGCALYSILRVKVTWLSSFHIPHLCTHRAMVLTYIQNVGHIICYPMVWLPSTHALVDQRKENCITFDQTE